MSPQGKGTTAPAQRDRTNQGGRVAATLLKYLTTHPGVELFRQEIAEATGLTEHQIRTNLSNLRNSDKLGAREALETVVAGQVWRWRPNKATGTLAAPAPEPTPIKSERLYREIGQTREGDSILQADDGSLWRAVEL